MQAETHSSSESVAIIIPVKNGLPYISDICTKIKDQDYDGTIEVICIDSGSQDGSADIVLQHGFRLVRIPSSEFGHGRTRNLGAEIAQTEFIVFLTHDAVPADNSWLHELVKPMRDDPQVAGVFSRHIAHPDSDPFTAWELEQHFLGLSEYPVVGITDRQIYDSDIGMQQLFHFFSDNSSALRRSVWMQFPYPDVQFAEDQIWAKTVVEAGYKKAFAYNSVVFHSHSFGPVETLRRSFDESRAFRKLFGYILCKNLRDAFVSGSYLLRRDIRNAFSKGWWKTHPAKSLSRVLECYARPIGHYLGSRERLSPSVQQRLSRDEWIRKL